VSLVVETEALGIVAPPAAAEPLEKTFRAIAAVEILARDETFAIAAEIASEAQRAPVTTAMRKIVEFVDAVAATVEQHADAAAGDLADAGADALAKTFVAGVSGLYEFV